MDPPSCVFVFPTLRNDGDHLVGVGALLPSRILGCRHVVVRRTGGNRRIVEIRRWNQTRVQLRIWAAGHDAPKDVVAADLRTAAVPR